MRVPARLRQMAPSGARLLVLLACLSAGTGARALPGITPARVIASFVVTTVELPPLEPLPCKSGCVAPGVLTLNTQPWTALAIDGTPSGSTPIFRHRLLPGMHRVRFMNEARGIDTTEVFEVKSGKATKVIGRFTAAHAALDYIATPAQPAQLFGNDCAADLLHPAFLSAETQPWTRVFVDGKLIGSTPLFRIKIAPGPHTVRFQNREQGLELSTSITPREGELVKLVHAF